MQFDVVVGNPPYNSAHRGVKLWPKFWRRAFEQSRRWIVFITPSSWMGPFCKWGGRRLWDRLDDVGAWSSGQFPYPGQGVKVAHVLVDLGSKAGLHLQEPHSPKLRVVPGSEIEYVESQLAEDPVDKAVRYYDGWRVSWYRSRKLREDTVQIWSPDETSPDGLSYMRCEDQADAERVRQVLLDKRDIFNRHCRWGGWVSDQIVHLFVERRQG
jgi:hypothetical protein